MNKVQPIELVEEKKEVRTENKQRERPRRQALMIADLK